MNPPGDLFHYDFLQEYAWNYEHAPDVVAVDVPTVSGDWSFCGLPVSSPLGMPAGPLLNGQWILYYAALGFDVLTYKTVRSSTRECYPLPNLQPVESKQMMRGGEVAMPVSETMSGNWAVSFGMPSAAPDSWRADIEWTRKQLPSEKVLSVSVVGTVQPGWSIDDLATDYAQCAAWAAESGADCIETNFSCPNVETCDGQLYLQAEAAGKIATAVRREIGSLPYIVKIGHLTDDPATAALIDALSGQVNALATTNSIAATVVDDCGELLFDGQQRGICGDATREASVAQTRRLSRIIEERNADIEIIGVGGASTAEHVRQYLNAGAGSVHIATAAMTDPLVGIKIRAEL